ncbi:hypothetical protein FDP41_007175 [Naegleria fowleri]|uniref:Uncharacterized protein n=1 Tax=Naegleria fowleri TaxID=5763 RepID=A0A6A5BIA7_NAEFO|nr:uncharacterized protein FDP41_007175 [Naegleria fowleri]KAF0973788.1 hypothetical protein FDP41_007175 [Naegleria fowleri]
MLSRSSEPTDIPAGPRGALMFFVLNTVLFSGVLITSVVWFCISLKTDDSFSVQQIARVENARYETIVVNTSSINSKAWIPRNDEDSSEVWYRAEVRYLSNEEQTSERTALTTPFLASQYSNIQNGSVVFCYSSRSPLLKGYCSLENGSHLFSTWFVFTFFSGLGFGMFGVSSLFLSSPRNKKKS